MNIRTKCIQILFLSISYEIFLQGKGSWSCKIVTFKKGRGDMNHKLGKKNITNPNNSNILSMYTFVHNNRKCDHSGFNGMNI
jgi:hypothetical protein